MGRCWLLGLLLVGGAPLFADDAVPAEPAPRWWKGNLHTHSLWSDGDDFPEMIAEWYRTHGYHFLALSDHNVLSEGKRYMPIGDIVSRGGERVIPKYRARFGGGWVEEKDGAIRLKPLDEFRYLVEERGKFIMIPGEEISDQAEGVPVHMNATNVKQVIEPAGRKTVRETLRQNLRAVAAQQQQLGRELMVHLNHPNFGYAITAEDLAAVVQERFFEVYNGHPAVNQRGDKDHPSIERLWDIANTIRVGSLNAQPLLGIATDDCHTYHGKPGSRPGRGWVMVRAAYLTPEHLLRNLKAGNFYASSGVQLEDFGVDHESGEIWLKIQGVPGEQYETRFVGTRRGINLSGTPRAPEPKGRTSKRYDPQVGATFATQKGQHPRYRLRGDELYVRAVVTSSALHPDPSLEGQFQQAWTQPHLPRK